MSRKLADQKYKNWLDLANKELKDRNIEDLYWQTPEGIEVKPLYTEDDLKNLSHQNWITRSAPLHKGTKSNYVCK